MDGVWCGRRVNCMCMDAWTYVCVCVREMCSCAVYARSAYLLNERWCFYKNFIFFVFSPFWSESGDRRWMHGQHIDLSLLIYSASTTKISIFRRRPLFRTKMMRMQINPICIGLLSPLGYRRDLHSRTILFGRFGMTTKCVQCAVPSHRPVSLHIQHRDIDLMIACNGLFSSSHSQTVVVVHFIIYCWMNIQPNFGSFNCIQFHTM